MVVIQFDAMQRPTPIVQSLLNFVIITSSVVSVKGVVGGGELTPRLLSLFKNRCKSFPLPMSFI